MVDQLFVEPRLARLYDAFCAGRDDFEFYLPYVMAADSVLDVGCGTGALLHLARAAGHRGRLCGLDPADAMLDCARVRSDIEWVHGDLSTFATTDRFDLIVMTGHAFQVLVTDAELRGALQNVRALFTDGGMFAFETRNPAARAWDHWVPENADEVVVAGQVVRMAHAVEACDGDTVTFSSTFTGDGWERPEVSRSTLRFLDAPALTLFLDDAGLEIAAQFGDWDGRPLAPDSPEIITFALS